MADANRFSPVAPELGPGPLRYSESSAIGCPCPQKELRGSFPKPIRSERFSVEYLSAEGSPSRSALAQILLVAGSRRTDSVCGEQQSHRYTLRRTAVAKILFVADSSNADSYRGGQAWSELAGGCRQRAWLWPTSTPHVGKALRPIWTERRARKRGDAYCACDSRCSG